jgi:hypothetical protein
MKKIWAGLLTALYLTVCASAAMAAPEPTKLVEVFRKPDVNYSGFKSFGNEVSISIRPVGDSFYDPSDPFLRQRLAEMTLLAAKSQGWVPMDNISADVRVSVKLTEWGRFRNKQDQNLMEFFALEVRAYSSASGEMILRATARYSRVDPVEGSMEKMNAAYTAAMEEILLALKTNQ